jgi:hypothetical protein
VHQHDTTVIRRRPARPALSLLVHICPAVIIIATYKFPDTRSVHFHQLVVNFHLHGAFPKYTSTTFAVRLPF